MAYKDRDQKIIIFSPLTPIHIFRSHRSHEPYRKGRDFATLYHPTADTNGRSRVVGVPVYDDWNAPFLFFVAFLAELY